MRKQIAVLVLLSASAFAQQTMRPTNATLNGVVSADAQAGSDIGAKINAAVASCVALGNVCNIQVGAAGTISTPFDLPIGFSLSFAPQGQYLLSTHLVFDHRSTTYNFNGAHLLYTLADGGTAIYVGKNISSTVNISGSTVTWVSGSQFGKIDVGDQIYWNSGGPHAANVAGVTSTTLTLTASVGTYTSAPMVAYQYASGSLGSYPANNVTIRDLLISETSATAADTALTIELVDSIRLDHFTASLFTKGTCINLLGAIAASITASGCYVDGNGISLKNNSIGGFVVSQANANRFLGLDLWNSPLATGSAIKAVSGSGNSFLALHIEGNANNTVISDASGGNRYQFTDYETNGTGRGWEVNITGNQDVIEGPAQFQSYNTQLISIGAGTIGSVVQDLTFNTNAGGAIAYKFFGPSGSARNNILSGTATAVNPNYSQDANGNVSANTVSSPGATTSGAGAGDHILKNATSSLRSATATNDATFPLIQGNASNQVVIDPGNQGTSFGGSIYLGTNVVLPSSLTGDHGDSTKVQLSDGTGRSGNLPKFDANGNVTDGGISAAAVPTKSGTPTVNAGVCWKTPSVLGTCTAGAWPNCTTCN